MDRMPLNKRQTLELFKDKKIVVSSHLLGPIVLDNQTSHALCHHVAHPWDESCINGSANLFLGSFKACIKVYASLYILSAALRGRPLKYWITRLPKEILQSAVFLTVNCGLYIVFFCLARKCFGGISYYGSLLASFGASLIAILMERKQRRGLLALYLTNLATETIFNMMVSRNLIKSIPNGEVALFAIGSAIYAYLFKKKSLDGSIQSLIKMLIGPSECLDVDHSLHKNRSSRVVKYYGLVTASLNHFLQLIYSLTISRPSRHNRSHNPIAAFFRFLERKLDHYLTSLSRSTRCRHHLCNHRYNCLIYSIMGFVQRFIVGFLLQLVIKCAGSIGSLVKSPKLIVKLIKSPANRELGLFLGSYVLIFRCSSCLLRWITNRNNEIQGLISGFCAGWSMIFYKSSSIALYLNFKLLEILWMLGAENKKLLVFKSFDIILYSISTAFMLWVALYEPHNIRPAYQRFINKISDRRFQQINRNIFDVFGVQSSTIERYLVGFSTK